MQNSFLMDRCKIKVDLEKKRMNHNWALCLFRQGYKDDIQNPLQVVFFCISTDAESCYECNDNPLNSWIWNTLVMTFLKLFGFYVIMAKLIYMLFREEIDLNQDLMCSNNTVLTGTVLDEGNYVCYPHKPRCL